MPGIYPKKRKFQDGGFFESFINPNAGGYNPLQYYTPVQYTPSAPIKVDTALFVPPKEAIPDIDIKEYDKLAEKIKGISGQQKGVYSNFINSYKDYKNKVTKDPGYAFSKEAHAELSAVQSTLNPSVLAELARNEQEYNTAKANTVSQKTNSEFLLKDGKVPVWMPDKNNVVYRPLEDINLDEKGRLTGDLAGGSILKNEDDWNYFIENLSRPTFKDYGFTVGRLNLPDANEIVKKSFADKGERKVTQPMVFKNAEGKDVYITPVVVGNDIQYVSGNVSYGSNEEALRNITGLIGDPNSKRGKENAHNFYRYVQTQLPPAAVDAFRANYYKETGDKSIDGFKTHLQDYLTGQTVQRLKTDSSNDLSYKAAPGGVGGAGSVRLDKVNDAVLAAVGGTGGEDVYVQTSSGLEYVTKHFALPVSEQTRNEKVIKVTGNPDKIVYNQPLNKDEIVTSLSVHGNRYIGGLPLDKNGISSELFYSTGKQRGFEYRMTVTKEENGKTTILPIEALPKEDQSKLLDIKRKRQGLIDTYHNEVKHAIRNKDNVALENIMKSHEEEMLNIKGDLREAGLNYVNFDLSKMFFTDDVVGVIPKVSYQTLKGKYKNDLWQTIVPMSPDKIANNPSMSDDYDKLKETLSLKNYKIDSYEPVTAKLSALPQNMAAILEFTDALFKASTRVEVGTFPGLIGGQSQEEEEDKKVKKNENGGTISPLKREYKKISITPLSLKDIE